MIMSDKWPDIHDKVDRKIITILILQTIFLVGIFIITNYKEIAGLL